MSTEPRDVKDASLAVIVIMVIEFLAVALSAGLIYLGMTGGL